jgi:hypothetical protein
LEHRETENHKTHGNFFLKTSFAGDNYRDNFLNEYICLPHKKFENGWAQFDALFPLSIYIEQDLNVCVKFSYDISAQSRCRYWMLDTGCWLTKE